MKHKRFAFVVGNSEYEHLGVLPNAKNDAQAMAASLRDLGFIVTDCVDRDRSTMMDALRKFQQEASEAAEILFYYCGHGLQVDGVNYLVPIEADFAQKEDLAELISFQDIVDRLSREDIVNLFFLDACRNDPFDQSLAVAKGRSVALKAPSGDAPDVKPAITRKGLAPVDAGLATLIGFAAAPGKTAADGRGRHSPYTEAMLLHMRTRGLEVRPVMARIGETVRVLSRKISPAVQDPWISTNLGSPVYFNPPSWKPVWVLGLMAAAVGLLVGPLVFEEGCFQKTTGLGFPFGLVVGYGVWKWGRGTWWAVLLSVAVTTLSWVVAGLVLDRTVLALQGQDCTATDENFDVRVGFFGAVSAVLALMGTLGGAALTSKALKALRSITAWATTFVVAILVSGIYFGAIYLIGKATYVDDLIRYSAAVIWYGALGASIGYAFARYVPSGPYTE
jgi:hypothetical protein